MSPYRLDKQQLADAVVEAATYVLQDILTYRPTRGQMEITPIQFTRDEITVVTRLGGDLSAELFLGLSRETAMGVASRMVREDVETLGAMEISALAELGNMITETALALLEERGALCYSTWAGVIQGRDERVTPFSLPTLAVPLRLVVGEMNLNVMLEGYAPFGWASPEARMKSANTVRVSAPAGDEDAPLQLAA